MTKPISFLLTALGGAAMSGLIFATPAPTAAATAAMPASANVAADGVLRVKSLYGFDETVARLKANVAAKGIRFFDEIDQSQLGAGAKIDLGPSKLLIFGNPPLGVQFLTSNRYAGLDWPVRMLVIQDPDGTVHVAWTDFNYIKGRYAIADRDAAFKMASEVSASIASSVTQ
ncbi:MAG TPA: DUF302 domain-containing protein [Caulobacteraceae bacterium]|jgi:uncharacterized protein (DUF302 family)|nr:DUF302 domain-containing protein [Caulobacteraceae bacterium]